MPLKITCPRCGKLHRNIKKEFLGKRFQCECGKIMRLGSKPGKKPDPPAPAAPPMPKPVTPKPVAKPVAPKQDFVVLEDSDDALPMASPVSNPPVNAMGPPLDIPESPRQPQSEPIKAEPAPKPTTPVAKSSPAPTNEPVSKNEPASIPEAPPNHGGAETIGSEFDDIDDLIADVTAPTNKKPTPAHAAPAQPVAAQPAPPAPAPPKPKQPQPPAKKAVEKFELSKPTRKVPKPAAANAVPEELGFKFPDPVDKANESSVAEESFEILDESDDDVMDLSDVDVVTDMAPQIVTPIPVAPTPAPAPQPVAPVILPASQPVPTAQPVQMVTEPIEAVGQQAAGPKPTNTSMNPIYQHLGPPPPPIFPAEPAVPDGKNSPQAIAGQMAGASGSMGGFQSAGRGRSQTSGEAALGIVAAIVGAIAVIYGLWMAFKCYEALDTIWTFSSIGGSSKWTAKGVFFLCILGMKGIGGLAVSIAGGMMTANEISKVANGRSVISFASITALATSGFMLLVIFMETVFWLTNKLIDKSDLFVTEFLHSLVPIALLVFAILRLKK